MSITVGELCGIKKIAASPLRVLRALGSGKALTPDRISRIQSRLSGSAKAVAPKYKYPTVIPSFRQQQADNVADFLGDIKKAPQDTLEVANTMPLYTFINKAGMPQESYDVGTWFQSILANRRLGRQITPGSK